LATGAGALPIAEGPHRPMLWLETGDGWHQIPLAAPASVLPNAGQITLSVTPAEWAKAVAEWKAKTKPGK
jgi:hypothetical protein